MTAGAGALVFPHGDTSDDVARQQLAAGFANVILTEDDIEAINFTATNAICVPEIVVSRSSRIVYARDPDDETTDHTPPACIVSQDGHRFKSALAASAFTHVESVEDDLPVDAAEGDTFLVSAAPTGDFAAEANNLCLVTSAGPVFVAPIVGQRVFVRDVDRDYQYRDDGAWHDTVAVSSIGAQELQFPFGMVVEDEIATPPDSVISAATGANIGDLTGGGGLAAANDGTTSQAAAACATKAGATVAWIGKDYSAAPKKINRVVVTPSNDQGFATGAPNITLELYGKNGSAPVDPAAGVADLTLLGTSASAADGLSARAIGCNQPNTEWDYIVVRILSSTSQTISIAELQRYTPTILAAGVKYIAAANAISAFATHDTKVMEANGDGTWTALAPYTGAIVFQKARAVPIRWSGSAWANLFSGWINVATPQVTPGSGSTTVNSGTVYTFTETGLPLAGDAGREDDVGFNYAARAIGTKNLRVRYEAHQQWEWGSSADSADVPVLVLKRDGTPIAHVRVPGIEVGGANQSRTSTQVAEFWIDAVDTATHTYTIRALVSAGTAAPAVTCNFLSNRKWSIEERA